MSLIMNQATSVIPIGGVATLTGNSGGAVPPSAGNINIVGSGGVTVTGNPGTSTLTITGDGGIQTVNGDVGSVTGTTITLTGGTSGAVFTGAGSTLTESFNFLSLPITSSTNGQILINGGTVFHTFGGTNTFVGASSGNFTLTGFSSVGVGANTLGSVTSGSFNTVSGFLAGNAITTGSNNVGMGSGALLAVSLGDQNVGIGNNTLDGITTGDGNIALGHMAGEALTVNDSNNIMIGNIGVVADSGRIRIGTNATHTSTFIAGIDGVNVGSVAKVLTMASDQIGTATLTAGAGISITPGANTVTIASTVLGTWTEVTGTSASMAVDNGYIANNVGLVTLTLPAVAAVGDEVRVAGKGSGLWRIAQNAGQTIHFGAVNTTTGAGGSLSAIAQYDCVELLCITANTDFVVLSVLGNLATV